MKMKYRIMWDSYNFILDFAILAVHNQDILRYLQQFLRELYKII